MKIRMVTNKAGMAAARYTHQGFPPKGATNHPRCGLVGLKERKRDLEQYQYIPHGEKLVGKTVFYLESQQVKTTETVLLIGQTIH